MCQLIGLTVSTQHLLCYVSRVELYIILPHFKTEWEVVRHLIPLINISARTEVENYWGGGKSVQMYCWGQISKIPIHFNKPRNTCSTYIVWNFWSEKRIWYFWGWKCFVVNPRWGTHKGFEIVICKYIGSNWKILQHL